MRILDSPLASLRSSGLWFSTALAPCQLGESVHSELRLLHLALGAGSHLCAGRVMLDGISKASLGGVGCRARVEREGEGRMGKGKARLRSLDGEWLTWL